jgi:hypothetical protein
MRAGSGIHQPKGRRLRGEHLSWMRLECNHAQWGIGPAGQVDHMAMTTVHAIEISDGG